MALPSSSSCDCDKRAAAKLPSLSPRARLSLPLCLSLASCLQLFTPCYLSFSPRSPPCQVVDLPWFHRSKQAGGVGCCQREEKAAAAVEEHLMTQHGARMLTFLTER